MNRAEARAHVPWGEWRSVTAAMIAEMNANRTHMVRDGRPFLRALAVLYHRHGEVEQVMISDAHAQPGWDWKVWVEEIYLIRRKVERMRGAIYRPEERYYPVMGQLEPIHALVMTHLLRDYVDLYPFPPTTGGIRRPSMDELALLVRDLDGDDTPVHDLAVILGTPYVELRKLLMVEAGKYRVEAGIDGGAFLRAVERIQNSEVYR